jgi:putative transposase
MAKRGYQPEQIISKLREVEILLSTGHTVQTASRHIGVTEQTYYRWRKEYGQQYGEIRSIYLRGGQGARA